MVEEYSGSGFAPANSSEIEVGAGNTVVGTVMESDMDINSRHDKHTALRSVLAVMRAMIRERS